MDYNWPKILNEFDNLAIIEDYILTPIAKPKQKFCDDGAPVSMLEAGKKFLLDLSKLSWTVNVERVQQEKDKMRQVLPRLGSIDKYSWQSREVFPPKTVKVKKNDPNSCGQIPDSEVPSFIQSTAKDKNLDVYCDNCVVEEHNVSFISFVSGDHELDCLDVHNQNAMGECGATHIIIFNKLTKDYMVLSYDGHCGITCPEFFCFKDNDFILDVVTEFEELMNMCLTFYDNWISYMTVIKGCDY